MTAKPRPGEPISMVFVGADDQATFEAVAAENGVIFPYTAKVVVDEFVVEDEPGRSVEGYTLSGDYRDGEVITLAELFEDVTRYRPGAGVTVIGPYARVVTPGTYDEDGVEIMPPVMGAGVTYTIGVDASWIERMVEDPDDDVTAEQTPAALVQHWTDNGAQVVKDGTTAHELNGVWIFEAQPPGARVIAGAI